MDGKCRICSRTAGINLDETAGLLPLCTTHGELVIEELRNARTLDRNARALGFGQPAYGRDVLPDGTPTPGVIELRCDHSTVELDAHRWHGRPGDPCYWCLALHVERLREERDRALAPIEYDEQDARYRDEVIRRGRRLTNAVSIGLVTRAEALNLFDRWSAHV